MMTRASLLRRKFATVLALAPAERRLLVEAVVMLGAARIAARAVPLRRLAPWLACVPDVGEPDRLLIARVRRAVTRAAANVPWKALCMQQALAAKTMLARRGCGSAFHLGAGYDAQGGMMAHAWLVAGGELVVGGAGLAGITPLERFG